MHLFFVRNNPPAQLKSHAYVSQDEVWTSAYWHHDMGLGWKFITRRQRTFRASCCFASGHERHKPKRFIFSPIILGGQLLRVKSGSTAVTRSLGQTKPSSLTSRGGKGLPMACFLGFARFRRTQAPGGVVMPFEIWERNPKAPHLRLSKHSQIPCSLVLGMYTGEVTFWGIHSKNSSSHAPSVESRLCICHWEFKRN